MNFKEELTWILDSIDDKYIDNELYKRNIDFVHSLGKKCDCVGWSVLNVSEPDAEKILDKISNYCKKNGSKTRGFYDRTYTDITSDWFELQADSFKDNNMYNYY